MKKLVVYPYTESYSWVFENYSGINFDSIIGVFPFAEEDYVKQMGKNYITSEKKFHEELNNCDCLWIVNGIEKLEFESKILEKVKKAIAMNKEVAYLRTVTSEEKKMLKEFIDKKDIFSLCMPEENVVELYDIDVPILYVVGLSYKINSFGELIQLKNSFQEVGYNVGVICDTKEAEYCSDCYYLSSPYVNQIEIIMDINHFVKKLENKYCYDLLIVGLIKGVGIFGRKIIENWGTQVYSWAKAVPPDCIILNTFYGDYTIDILKKIGQSVETSIGSKIDFYNISDQIIDVGESEKKHYVCTWSIDQKTLQEKMSSLKDKSIYSTVLKSDIKRLRDDIVKKLSEYGEAVRM
ncbi:hypothetical protein [Faecalicatena contorta]|uniref:Peptide maturation system protein, TIGR04066 family n=1 Tax=Faecalicatena contorta TaxID=39482 RepID=A0A315ZRE0_9FIRM|nr:hypothetical protein [Faecalicatena contorta]PWJ48116.1 peptide maturation system protein (TIGR04066 family) [Faecalicatena contorta]SUQ15643.1 peptide maturation system protein, TIGR04066 family [Faecalicatena contorta]